MRRLFIRYGSKVQRGSNSQFFKVSIVRYNFESEIFCKQYLHLDLPSLVYQKTGVLIKKFIKFFRI